MVLICGYRLSSDQVKDLVNQYDEYHPGFRDNFSMAASNLKMAKHLPEDACIIVYKDEAFLAIELSTESKGFHTLDVDNLKRSVRSYRQILDDALVRNFFIDIDSFIGNVNPTYFWR